MSSRSAVSLGIIVKNFLRLAKHPWIGSKLVSLEAEKLFFNVLYPHRSTGLAQKIRQASFRITTWA